MRCKAYMYRTIVFSVSFFACTAVADIYDPGTDVEASFAEVIDNDAVTHTPSIQETANLVRKFNDETADGAQRLINGLSSFKEIVFYARRTLNPNSPLEVDLLKSLESVWQQLLGSSPQDELSRPTNWRIDQDDFAVNLIPNERVLNFKTAYLDRVTLSSDAYRKAIDSIGILLLTQQTLDYVKRKDALERIGAVARERTARWEVYLDQSIPQWPWELAFVNGPIYEYTLKHEKGLGRVPEWQLIVAHPDVALEYVGGATDGDQFKPALMIEIIGADFWSWETGAKQKGPLGLPFPLGAGLVATFTDRANSDDWGLGGVIHINHIYNLGATVRGSDTGIFFSVNLAKLFEDKRKKADKYLRMAGL
ncbi:MAG: hypothetical protein GY809_07815 [Planctomycetes bacterium]|nr:hypothetical protein [Planctomycetota bacterium]